MATKYGFFGAQFLMAVMIVALFCVTKSVAQDSEIAPTSQLQAGSGLSLPLSGLALGFSLLASLFALI
ncbi:hypothetical protein HN51_015231 [Arachis hypogaea]